MARLLASTGFVQEQAALHRMLDEFNEDILLLVHGLLFELTPLHTEYLAAFYEEEFDKPDDPLASSQKRAMIPRQRIRAYLSRIAPEGLDPSTGVEVMRTIQKIYSGFVHGASPHIMEMYGGVPPKWHVRGMTGTTRADDHSNDLWNVFYRSIASFAVTAKAFGDDKLFGSIMKYMKEFATAAGEDFSRPPPRVNRK